MKTKESDVLMTKIYKSLSVFGRRSPRLLLLMGVALLLTLYLYIFLATLRPAAPLPLWNRQLFMSRGHELELKTLGEGQESLINGGLLRQDKVISEVNINAKKFNEAKVEANVKPSNDANSSLPNSINEQTNEYETPLVFNSHKITGAQNEDRRSMTDDGVLGQDDVITDENLAAKEFTQTKVHSNVKLKDDANRNLAHSSNEQSSGYEKLLIDTYQHKVSDGLDVDNKKDTTMTKDNDEPLPTFIPYEPDTSPLGRPPTIPKRFLIEETDFCHRRPGLQIIAYVHSSIRRISQRNFTRTTWANASAYNMGDISVKIGVVFMVGRAENDEEQRIIQDESQRYHDIVQGDYGDHYRLLTYKGLAGLYWISRHCAHVPWTLHSDDDTHIDVFLYHRALQELDMSKKMFVCSHMYGPVLRTGRWNVRIEEFPDNDYPLYCSGGVWFLQTKFVPLLLEASKSVPFLWVDDAYITGLLAKQAGIEQFPFHMYYGNANVKVEKLGKEVAWFVKFAPRWVWWDKIVKYHRKHSVHHPVTLIAHSE